MTPEISRPDCVGPDGNELRSDWIMLAHNPILKFDEFLNKAKDRGKDVSSLMGLCHFTSINISSLYYMCVHVHMDSLLIHFFSVSRGIIIYLKLKDYVSLKSKLSVL